MKLNNVAFEYAKSKITSKDGISHDDWDETDSDMSVNCALGKDDDDSMAYSFSKAGNVYSQAFKAISVKAKEAGDEEVGNAADLLEDMCMKSFPELAPKSKGINITTNDGKKYTIDLQLPKSFAPKKLHRTFKVINDKEFIKTLSKGKEEKPNSYWALASVEIPEGDSDGDIIVVAGIEADIDPSVGKYLPLLPSHNRTLESGHAAEIGRIDQLVKTSYGGLPALAFHFEFALDEDGKPIDDLVASYYKRYTLGYSNTFSVGMEATSEPERIDTGGYKFNNTRLFEVSSVSIPANSGAIGLTRSQDSEDTLVLEIKELKKAVSDLKDALGSINSVIDNSFSKAFKPLEDRLDLLESTIVVKENKQPEEKPVDDFDLVKELDRVLSKHIKKDK